MAVLFIIHEIGYDCRFTPNNHLKPKSVIRDFSCKKLDYSRLFHRYSIYILTQYASFTLFQDKMKAKFSNDRFGLNVSSVAQ